jgi:hypothetical protein
MQKINWRIILLCLLLLAVVVLLTGCALADKMENTTRALSNIPARLGQVIVDLMSGIGNIGNALANQVGNIIKGMTGH